MLHSYRMISLENEGQALVATPEKALLDLVYLQPGGDSIAYLQELRLQNLEQLDLKALAHLAEHTGMPKLRRAAAIITEFAQAEAQEYERL
jgi:hypothetical protein